MSFVVYFVVCFRATIMFLIYCVVVVVLEGVQFLELLFCSNDFTTCI